MRLRTILALTTLLVAAGCTGIPTPAPSNSGNTPTTSATVTPPSDGTQVTVVRVIDGDTMDVEYANGSTERVRLLGVDTPETHTGVSPEEWEGVPGTQAGRQCLQTWGDRASQYATRELAGKTVTLALDPESDVRGGYGRLLGYLVYNGSSFNYRLIETGHARMYDSQFSRRDEYAAIEQAAMAREAGAWTCRTPSTPESGDDGSNGSGGSSGDDGASGDGSSGSGDGAGSVDVALSISVHADADGHDGQNLNDEYVTLTNTGDTEIDVSGWTITDAADHTYEFGDRTIAPGASLTLPTGSGTANATHVYWGASSPVWNNGGDTATVRNETGAIAAQTSY